MSDNCTQLSNTLLLSTSERSDLIKMNGMHRVFHLNYCTNKRYIYAFIKKYDPFNDVSFLHAGKRFLSVLPTE